MTSSSVWRPGDVTECCGSGSGTVAGKTIVAGTGLQIVETDDTITISSLISDYTLSGITAAYAFTASVGQTDFMLPSNAQLAEGVVLYRNGVRQLPSIDYYTQGSTVILYQPCQLGTQIEIEVRTAVVVGDTNLNEVIQYATQAAVSANNAYQSALDAGAAAASQVVIGINDHVAAVDPHSQYVLDTTLAAYYNASEVDTLLGGKEGSLGNPVADGYVLTSTAAGVRSWASAPSQAWGSLTGTLSDQTDLSSALAGKLSLAGGGTITQTFLTTPAVVIFGNQAEQVVTLRITNDSMSGTNRSAKLELRTGGESAAIVRDWYSLTVKDNYGILYLSGNDGAYLSSAVGAVGIASTSSSIINTYNNLFVCSSNTVTGALVLNAAGAMGFGATHNYGTAGQVLTSQGSGDLPAWSTMQVLNTNVVIGNSTINTGFSLLIGGSTDKGGILLDKRTSNFSESLYFKCHSSDYVHLMGGHSTGGIFLRTIAGDMANDSFYFSTTGDATVVTPLGKLGYGAGAGGTVTQATSRTTGVTINKPAGSITLVSAAGSTTFASFTVTNSVVAVTDCIVVTQKSGTDLYEIHVTNVSAGSFNVSFRTISGTTTEQPVFNFAVIKGAWS